MANMTFGSNILPKDNNVSLGSSDSGKQWTIVSPNLTGTPIAPTASSATNNMQVATTAFVQNALSSFTGGSNITAVSVSVAAGAWSNGIATVTVNGVTSSNNIMVGMGGNITAAQESAVLLGEIMCTGQSTNSITLKAFGVTPTVAIPINVFIFD